MNKKENQYSPTPYMLLPRFIYTPLSQVKKSWILTVCFIKLRLQHGITNVGKNVVVIDGFKVFSGGKNITIGNNVCLNDLLINAGSVDSGRIKIGNNVFFGHRCMILARSHNYQLTGLARIKSITAKDILIEDGVWIASGVTILGGVTIGKNSVVAAGSIVTKSILKNSVYAGIPAKKVKRIIFDR